MRLRWLKKYTDVKYAESILTNRELHLGDPDTWPDKNDSELIRIYAETNGIDKVRVTCMTSARDRYHFWKVFGNVRNGVCFWFDRKSLLTYISMNDQLISKKVRYRKPRAVSELPFCKRSQYSDEQEFRVLKHCISGDPKTSISFSAHSLKRIYFNAWLSDNELKLIQERLVNIMKSDFNHVELLQSRIIRRKAWINHAKHIAQTESSIGIAG